MASTPVLAERARILLGAAAFVLLAAVVVELQLVTGAAQASLWLYALALGVGYACDRRLKIAAAQGRGTLAGVVSGALLVSASAAGIDHGPPLYLLGAFLIGGVLAGAGGALSVLAVTRG